MLTISRLSRWSINYSNDTANKAQTAAMDRQAAGGGLGEYYSESDTRVPTWVVVGNSATGGELTGLDGAALAGGFADTDVAARWLDDGIAPNGAGGRVFTKESVHGFDLTFAAPKSVSLLRALAPLHGPADVTEKTLQNAHQKAVEAAMTYLHQHAGYTRVHNPRTGNKDLERLPGLVGAARHPFGHRGIRSVPRQGTQGTRDAAYRPHRFTTLTRWLREHDCGPTDPVFPTRRGRPLSTDAVAWLLTKHAATAARRCPSLNDKHLTPHVLRHTAAMQLLHSGAAAGRAEGRVASPLQMNIQLDIS
jgi:hypothetical protein